MTPADEFVVRRAPQPGALCPFSLVDPSGMEVSLVGRFLDGAMVRGLSTATLRTYAFGSKHVFTWLQLAGLDIEHLTEADLTSFIKFVQGRSPNRAAPRTVNLYLVVLRLLFTFATGREIPSGPHAPRESQPWRTTILPGRLLPTPAEYRPVRKLRVKVDQRLISPLTAEEVNCVVETFASLRDKAIVSLFVLGGLRSCELLRLRLDDIDHGRGEMRVLGKGSKERILPLAPEVAALVSHYIDVERPASRSDRLFLVLKGPRRGEHMTPAGLRSVFRYHRRLSEVLRANPHRFRHTFAAQMVKAGMPLPILQRLMGHTTIEMTMRYVALSNDDIHQEYHRVLRTRRHER